MIILSTLETTKGNFLLKRLYFQKTWAQEGEVMYLKSQFICYEVGMGVQLCLYLCIALLPHKVDQGVYDVLFILDLT